MTADQQQLDRLLKQLSDTGIGNLTRYRRLCLERMIDSIEGRVKIAEEVLEKPVTGLNEAWYEWSLLKRAKSRFSE